MKKKNNRLAQIIKILRHKHFNKGITPEKVKETLEDLGPTFVKFGQVLSTRPDLLPRAYCEALATLCENVKPLPFSIVKETIEKEMNHSIEEVFSSIDETPLGSASIGQVHRAVLKDGTVVVCKVMRPNIYESSKEDILLLKKAANLTKLVPSISNVVDLNVLIDETWTSMQEEMNYQIEIKNNDEFTECFKEIQYVGFPKVYHEYSTSKLIVMEYVDGIRLTNEEKLNECYDKEDLINKLIENFVTQILDKGLFHADPHAGNVCVRDGKIIWLDLGMVGHIKERDRKLYEACVKAALAHDVESLKNLILTIGVVHRPVNSNKLYTDIDMMLTRYMSLDLQDIDLGQVMKECMQIAQSNHISLPRGITLLARSLIIFEGLVARVAPSANLMDIFSQHVKKGEWDRITKNLNVSHLAQGLYEGLYKSASIPSRLADFLYMDNKGERKLNLSFCEEEEHEKREESRLTRKGTILFLCFLFLGLCLVFSSLLLSRYNQALWIIGIIFVVLGSISFMFLLLLYVVEYFRSKK